MARRCSLCRLTLSLFFALSWPWSSCGQTISTNLPVPPLQWINLTPHLSGSAPPPLMYASIGYDETSRSLLIFGGESQGGYPQQQTYLLNLDTLTWSQPTGPDGLTSVPSARSGAIGGLDSGASYRRGHILIGGKDANGNGLSDVWEFDYDYKFWAQVTVSGDGPSARGGASGGIDFQVKPVSSPTLPAPNTTFYLSGGSSGSNLYPLSEVWELNITGTLSPNDQSVVGTWQRVSVHDSLTPKIYQGGAVVGDQIVSIGGCNSTSADDSCAQQDSYVITAASGNVIAPNACPAPRVGPAVVANTNGDSSSFNSQVFVLLGIFNDTLWNDDGGLQKGEVDVLDINGGTWARILPSGDPDVNPNFPSPREGAAALSYNAALVGPNRAAASDTIVFGGRGVSGNYTNEVWLLRAYNGSITQSNQHWSGYGDGDLQSGAGADGTGVTIQYMTRCAVALQSSVSSYPTPSSGPASPSSTSTTATRLDTSTLHKLLPPLSLGLLTIGVLAYRLSSPALGSQANDQHVALFYGGTLLTVLSWGIGIGGLVVAFTSQKALAVGLMKRSTHGPVLTTAHGRAGIALFLCLYGLVPLLMAVYAGWRYSHRHSPQGESDSPEVPTGGRARSHSRDTAEKLNSPGAETPPLSGRSTPGVGHHKRLHSWGGQGLFPALRGRSGRRSSESHADTVTSSGPQRSFEVVNRPNRPRHSSGNSLSPFSNDPNYQRVPIAPRSLSDLSWLERRRSLNAVGELDYALSQLGGGAASTPVTADIRSTNGLMNASGAVDQFQVQSMPPAFEILIRLLFHLSLLGLLILTLVALWYYAPIAGFAIFVAWTAIFYGLLLILSWRGRPRGSVLTVVLARLRGEQTVPSTPSRPASSFALDQYPFPTADPRGPYIHQPQVWSATEDYASMSHAGPRSTEEGYDDDDEDEDTRQRRIEDEMARREVSIVTVPKRRLWITNPS
ncbi:hypothetical protein GLOTRDRAFT_113979 [Gloeophyllum trabeum ATCC 11539]|uniref:Galactose oxidase n=1 Tax=Gloeophyllum trabeum (strain ATCC 11539 / FP-39264 / Madison 617) TaxID=670483 RepID=S7QIQ6_GLOTA|nr:uncharacterized protein GLOTRDRAFT_113979 [Gloeophyllum trabeum ATCC 11539]EPQ59227.1 hypothetical protein GLOTRDRAFT_113979 [Gloeophyllum trabeum ATCC 11539]